MNIAIFAIKYVLDTYYKSVGYLPSLNMVTYDHKTGKLRLRLMCLSAFILSTMSTMKKGFLVFMAALIVWGLALSCTSSLASRMDSFVGKVEKDYSTYTEKDWKKANEKFEKLYAEYKRKKESLTSAEKRQFNAAMVRYAKTVAKSNFEDLNGTVSNILENLSSFLDDAQSFLENLVSTEE